MNKIFFNGYYKDAIKEKTLGEHYKEGNLYYVYGDDVQDNLTYSKENNILYDYVYRWTLIDNKPTALAFRDVLNSVLVPGHLDADPLRVLCEDLLITHQILIDGNEYTEIILHNDDIACRIKMYLEQILKINDYYEIKQTDKLFNQDVYLNGKLISKIKYIKDNSEVEEDKLNVNVKKCRLTGHLWSMALANYLRSHQELMGIKMIGIYKCPCCGNYTMQGQNKTEVCPVCLWKDKEENSNNTKLKEAKENYKKYGTSDLSKIKLARRPRMYELPGFHGENQDDSEYIFTLKIRANAKEYFEKAEIVYNKLKSNIENNISMKNELSKNEIEEMYRIYNALYYADKDYGVLSTNRIEWLNDCLKIKILR